MRPRSDVLARESALGAGAPRDACAARSAHAAGTAPRRTAAPRRLHFDTAAPTPRGAAVRLRTHPRSRAAAARWHGGRQAGVPVRWRCRDPVALERLGDLGTGHGTLSRCAAALAPSAGRIAAYSPRTAIMRLPKYWSLLINARVRVGTRWAGRCVLLPLAASLPGVAVHLDARVGDGLARVVREAGPVALDAPFALLPVLVQRCDAWNPTRKPDICRTTLQADWDFADSLAFYRDAAPLPTRPGLIAGR